MKKILVLIIISLAFMLNANYAEVISPVEGGHYFMYSTVDVIVEGENINKIYVEKDDQIYKDWQEPFIVEINLFYELSATVYISVTFNDGETEVFDMFIYVDDDGISDLRFDTNRIRR